MAVTLSANIPQAAFPVGAAATSTVAWTYNVLDTASTGGVVATSPVWSTRPGLTPTLALTPRVPVGMPGLALTVMYTYYDLNLATLASGTVDSFSATSSTAARNITLPTAPANSRYWGVSLVMNEGASEVVQRTNFAPHPRFDVNTHFQPRNSWAATSTTAGTGQGDIGGITGLNTYEYAQGLAETGTYRGFNFGQAPDATTPTALNGSMNNALSLDGVGASSPTVIFSAGDYLAFSTYVYVTKAVTVVPVLRFFSGTTWTQAALSGTSVAVAANTWTRISIVTVVPAGATEMCGAVWVPASTTWTTSDQIRLTGVLIEKSSSLNAWFDSSYNPTSYSVRAKNINATICSQLYTPGQSTGRSVTLSSVTATVSSGATEIINASLKRPLRRSVYDALNVAAPQIAIGTPGLLAGQITYLCDTLDDAMALDQTYQYAGTITLNTGGALDGFKHMAVEDVNLTAEKAIPGYPSKWLVQVGVREIKAS